MPFIKTQTSQIKRPKPAAVIVYFTELNHKPFTAQKLSVLTADRTDSHWSWRTDTGSDKVHRLQQKKNHIDNKVRCVGAQPFVAL